MHRKVLAVGQGVSIARLKNYTIKSRANCN